MIKNGDKMCMTCDILNQAYILNYNKSETEKELKQMEKKYSELVKPRITDTRKMVISRINPTGQYKMVELAEFVEGDKKRAMILRGGIVIDSLINLRNVRDAINQVLDEEGFYETETGKLNTTPKRVTPIPEEMFEKSMDGIAKVTSELKAGQGSGKVTVTPTPPEDFEKIVSSIETVTGKEEPTQKPMMKPESKVVREIDIEETAEINIPIVQIEPEDDTEDWGEFEQPEPLPVGYDNLSPKELYTLCMSRGLSAATKKSRSYYINILEKSVDK